MRSATGCAWIFGTGFRRRAELRCLGSMRCTFVIPTYNGARRLRSVLESLQEVAPTVCSAPEYLIVDDKSSAEQWAEVAQVARESGACRVLQLTENVGQHRATLIGILLAQGEIVVTLDDDSPKDLVVAAVGNLALVAKDAHKGSVFFVRTEQAPDSVGVAVVRGLAKGAIAFLASSPSYLWASSTRILDATLVRSLVEKNTDADGTLVMPSCRLSLDALIFSAFPCVRFSKEVVAVGGSDSRYTFLGLVRHAWFVLLSMWHFKGPRAFMLFALLAGGCSWWYRGAAVYAVSLLMLAAIVSAATFRQPRQRLPIANT
jgi:glycosyltransferase involved in cell wall biosynthesis